MLFLIGFMAAGKTSVGRALAARSGRAFVDLDDAVSATTGEPVPALVARDEAAFRRAEAAALGRIIATGGDVIVATGGGAAAAGDNLSAMRAAGCVIALGVDLDEARARAVGGPARPLLARGDALLRERAPIYRRAHAVVDTTGQRVDDVVGAVAAAEQAYASAGGEAVVVALGDRSYPVTLTAHLDVALGAQVRARLPGVTRVALVTDDNVAAHWLDAASAALAAVGFTVELAIIPAGEASKSLAEYGRLCERLIAAGLDRTGAIVALGGGVVGDLAGFVAATLVRGLPVVHLPTTLVAMTDSAIGGKTAIDLPAGKNLVGAFHQPVLVACALATLGTLPARERRAGFGELWKYALLDGPDLWRAVDGCAPWAAGAALAPPPAALAAVIARAIAYKAAVVGRDERERTGHRALLNLGHTVGHAIEAASDGALLHGEAVGLGLLAACRISSAVLGVPSQEPAVHAALARTGLPTALDPWLTPPVLARLAVDKKRAGASMRFVTIRDVGRCEVTHIPLADLPRILLPAVTP